MLQTHLQPHTLRGFVCSSEQTSQFTRARKEGHPLDLGWSKADPPVPPRLSHPPSCRSPHKPAQIFAKTFLRVELFVVEANIIMGCAIFIRVDACAVGVLSQANDNQSERHEKSIAHFSACNCCSLV